MIILNILLSGSLNKVLVIFKILVGMPLGPVPLAEFKEDIILYTSRGVHDSYANVLSEVLER